MVDQKFVKIISEALESGLTVEDAAYEAAGAADDGELFEIAVSVFLETARTQELYLNNALRRERDGRPPVSPPPVSVKPQDVSEAQAQGRRNKLLLSVYDLVVREDTTVPELIGAALDFDANGGLLVDGNRGRFKFFTATVRELRDLEGLLTRQQNGLAKKVAVVNRYRRLLEREGVNTLEELQARRDDLQEVAA